MFKLINVETGEPVSEIVYSSPQEAMEAGKQLPVKTRLQRVVDDSWKLREAARLTDGTYEPLPDFVLVYITNQDKHFVHASKSDPDRVAYTQTPEKGMVDVQTTTTLGSYLSRYEPSLPDHAVRELVEKFTNRNTDASAVVIDYTAKAFRFAYEGQPVSHEASTQVSCMAYEARHYDCRPYHPAEAYSTGPNGLHIAYILDPEDSKAIKSRAIVWPRDMTFVKVYGRNEDNRTQLRVALEKLGYGRASSFRGALLAKISLDDDGTFVMPYLDGSAQCVDEYDEDNFVIAKDGDYSAEDTSGVLDIGRNSNRFTCDSCGDRCHVDDAARVSGESWCETCVQDYAAWCQYNDEYVHQDDIREVYVIGCNGRARAESWGSGPVARHAFRCDCTDRLYSREDYTAATVHVDHRGTTETWCAEACEDDFFECADCGECFTMDFFSHFDDKQGPICHDCADKRREAGEFIPSYIPNINQQELPL
jgi:hypothetical protein